MPPKTNTNNTTGEVPNFTSGELKLLHTVFRNAPSTAKPVTNWDVVAQETGLKNGSISSTRFNQVSKKYGWFGASAQGATTPGKAARGPKRVKKAASDNDDESTETPSKPKKSSKKHAAKPLQANDTKPDPEEEDDDKTMKKRKASQMDEGDEMDDAFDHEA